MALPNLSYLQVCHINGDGDGVCDDGSDCRDNGDYSVMVMVILTVMVMVLTVMVMVMMTLSFRWRHVIFAMFLL